MLIFIATFNYIMDPLWNFEHKHKFNQYFDNFTIETEIRNTFYFRSLKDEIIFYTTSLKFNKYFEFHFKFEL